MFVLTSRYVVIVRRAAIVARFVGELDCAVAGLAGMRSLRSLATLPFKGVGFGKLRIECAHTELRPISPLIGPGV